MPFKIKKHIKKKIVEKRILLAFRKCKIQLKLSRSKNIIYNTKLPQKGSKFDVFFGIKSFYRKIVKNEKHSRKGIKKIYKNM
jgi:hypothetical protein